MAATMPDSAAICSGCAGRFDPDALTERADQAYCGPCLARLGRPVVERDGALFESLLNRPRAARPAEGDGDSGLGLCFLCSQGVGSDAFVRLRQFVICHRCSQELMTDAPAVEEAPPAVVERGPAAARPARPAHTPGTGTEVCAGCGRLMPGPGSYRVVNGRPHCPACAPLAARAQVPRRPTPTPLPTPEPVTTPLCDCCVRPLAGDQFRAAGGFWLCLACLDSDEPLALAVARARYRRRLARMKAQLDPDEER